MKNAFLNGTYTEIFKTTTGTVIAALWAGIMMVSMLCVMLEYFDCLTR